MAFDFESVFNTALQAGLTAAKPGGQAAQDWVRESTQANIESLRAIALGVAQNQISKETAQMLLDENASALRSEAAALSVVIKAAAQAAVNAFFDSLFSALKSALKIAL